MMSNYLKRYNIQIETIGPVHISSGHELNKKEWIYDWKKKIGIFYDERKLFQYLKSNKLMESYEKFMLYDNKRRAYDWAVENNIYPRNIKFVEKYRVDCGGLFRFKTDKGIVTAIKDGYGLPYIPGSSLKGALRNALLAKYVSDNSYDQRDKVINELLDASGKGKRELEKAGRKHSCSINSQYFHTRNMPQLKKENMANDCMRGIRVSDSKPLSFDDLTVCQKIDINTNGDLNDKIPIARECIKPNTSINFVMTVDTTETNISVESIKQAIADFIEDYNKNFLSEFGTEEQYHDDVIYLGGGVGYHSKTITSEMVGDKRETVKLTSKIIDGTLKPKQRAQHKHSSDINMGVSPHIAKITEYDDEIYQMGACRISFEEF